MESKGKAFRRLLQDEPYLYTGGIYSPLDAQIAERAGMKSIYLSGYSVAMLNGWPDMGFLTQTEVTKIASMVASAVEVPIIADADDGRPACREPPSASRTTAHRLRRSGRGARAARPRRLVTEERHVLEHPDRLRIDALRERVATVREVVVAEHDVRGRKIGEQTLELFHPRRRDTRSPVMHTRSGLRSITHSTASRTARRPRDGTPRWRSERCAMRSPSSWAARLQAPRRARCVATSRPRTTPRQPAPQWRRRAAGRARSDGELLGHRCDRDDVALELELGAVEPGGDPHEL